MIDEADLMLDMGFMDEVRQIVGLLPEKRQTLLFSATLDEDVKNLAEETVKDAVSVFLEQEGETPLPIRRRTGPEVYGIQARSHEGKPGARHDILRYQGNGPGVIPEAEKRQDILRHDPR